jgi:hypothetical protein
MKDLVACWLDAQFLAPLRPFASFLPQTRLQKAGFWAGINRELMTQTALGAIVSPRKG